MENSNPSVCFIAKTTEFYAGELCGKFSFGLYCCTVSALNVFGKWFACLFHISITVYPWDHFLAKRQAILILSWFP